MTFDELSKLGLEDCQKLTQLSALTLDGAPTEEFKTAIATFAKQLQARQMMVGPDSWFTMIEGAVYRQLAAAEGSNPLRTLDHCRMAEAQELVQQHQKFMRASKWVAKQIALHAIQEYFG